MHAVTANKNYLIKFYFCSSLRKRSSLESFLKWEIIEILHKVATTIKFFANSYIKKKKRDFPGSPVVKNLCFHSKGAHVGSLVREKMLQAAQRWGKKQNKTKQKTPNKKKFRSKESAKLIQQADNKVNCLSLYISPFFYLSFGCIPNW